MNLHIEEAATVTEEVIVAVSGLLKQLTSRNVSFRIEDLREIIESDSSLLLVARASEGKIVGMVTLVFFRSPSGKRCRIEDIVVDESSRRLGIADALLREAERRARNSGVETIDLTSHPSRAAANALYRKLGYVARDTNVYRKGFPIQ